MPAAYWLRVMARLVGGWHLLVAVGTLVRPIEGQWRDGAWREGLARTEWQDYHAGRAAYSLMLAVITGWPGFAPSVVLAGGGLPLFSQIPGGNAFLCSPALLLGGWAGYGTALDSVGWHAAIGCKHGLGGALAAFPSIVDSRRTPGETATFADERCNLDAAWGPDRFRALCRYGNVLSVAVPLLNCYLFLVCSQAGGIVRGTHRGDAAREAAGAAGGGAEQPAHVCSVAGRCTGRMRLRRAVRQQRLLPKHWYDDARWVVSWNRVVRRL